MIFITIEHDAMFTGQTYLLLCNERECITTILSDQKFVAGPWLGGKIHDEAIPDLINFIKESQMPLVKGKKASTPKGFGENVKREMKEGKPQKQSVAIAYSEAREGKKKGKKK